MARPQKLSIFLFDESIRSTYPIIAGIDEAGRGPLAGPVVASAVILPQGLIINGLRDSKQVPEDERKRLFWDIICGAEDIGIGVADEDIIDRTNILKATKFAMEMAVKDLSIAPDILLIDAVKLTNLAEIAQKSIIRGESVSASIAAASIIAKVYRDSLMKRLSRTYPLYKFAKHKGYGTKIHQEAIRAHGFTKIHRSSYNLDFIFEK